MQLTITTEKRGEIEQIQRDFRRYLSEQEILRASSTAINGVLKRTQNRIRKLVSKEYNVSSKYMRRWVKIDPYSTPYSMWGGIQASTMPIPLIAFPAKQRGSTVVVTMHRGRPSPIPHAFIATVRGRGGGGPHTGVFSRGRYTKSGFYYYTKAERRKGGVGRTATGKVRITQRMGTSPISMTMDDRIKNDITQYMSSEVTARVHGILTSRVKKIQG